MNAIIKDNKSYCPFCSEHDYRIAEYKQVKKGTQMSCICRKCNREFEYILNLKTEERFNVEEDEEGVVRFE